MNILGISGGIKIGNQDGAAALLVDGRLVAAAEEERFVGIKFANGLLPKQATWFCLRHAGLTPNDLDAVVFAGATYDNFEEILQRFFDFNFGYAPAVKLVDHHTAHAASTYFGSGLDEALVITMDRSGDRMATTIRAARQGRLEEPIEIGKANSLGLFYSAITQYLGFQSDSDEYKVMGMAGYGEPNIDFSGILEATDDGYHFHNEFIRGILPNTPGPSKQERLFDEFPLPFPSRVPGSPIAQTHYDIAASAQHQLEQVVTRMVQHHLAATGMNRLCFAGGVALNCLMNQRVRQLDAVQDLYVPPVCSDAGLALGAAYLESVAQGQRPEPLQHAYWGPEFSPAEVRDELDRAGAAYRSTTDPVAAAIEQLQQGKILGWFQGRLEYGPRALGNRSILADPEAAEMKDDINKKVKFREEFRPLAPSLLHADGPRYFQDYADSPFMTQTFSITEQMRTDAAAAVHVDSTSRLQSVHSDTNPLYADLVQRWGRESGRPILLNTSLNAYNDPMACEPYQALRTFFTTGLDALVIGEFVLEKNRRAS